MTLLSATPRPHSRTGPTLSDELPPEPDGLPPDPDDLEGYETSMSRLASRATGWLALLLAAALVLPLGGWLVDELVFQRQGARVADEAGAELADAVWLVRALGCDGSSSSGSAFAARLGGTPVLVTNRHVAAGASAVGVRRLDGDVTAEIGAVRVSDRADVAVLIPTDPEVLEVALAFGGDPGLGAEVRVVGFPAARPYTTAGTVAEIHRAQMVLDLRVDPGASGAPVVNVDGEVVGQIYARTDQGDGIATPVGLLADAMRDAQPDQGCADGS